MRVYSLAAVLRPSAVAPLAAPPAPLSAAFGRTTVLPNPASLAGDDDSAARYSMRLYIVPLTGLAAAFRPKRAFSPWSG